MLFRLLVALVAAALIAFYVVRNALVVGLAATRPADASLIWSGHPAVELSHAMTQIAQASRGRRQVSPGTFAMIADAAVKEPLAPEPFLVRGIRAQLAGDGATAQRAFEEAQWRDPRSLPAAYFLAERYFQIGDMPRGLREVAALARLSPGGVGIVAPYLAAYARNPANWPDLKAMGFESPKELSRGHHASLSYAHVPDFITGLRARGGQWLV